MRDDRNTRERFPICSIPHRVIEMPMSVDQIPDGFVRPLLYLRNVLPGRRRQIARIDDEYLAFADDHGCVALWKRIRRILVSYRVNPFCDLLKSAYERF